MHSLNIVISRGRRPMHSLHIVVHKIGRRPKLVPLTLRCKLSLVSVPLKARGWHVGAIVMKAVRQVDTVFMERWVELQLVKPDLVANATPVSYTHLTLPTKA